MRLRDGSVRLPKLSTVRKLRDRIRGAGGRAHVTISRGEFAVATDPMSIDEATRIRLGEEYRDVNVLDCTRPRQRKRNHYKTGGAYCT